MSKEQLLAWFRYGAFIYLTMTIVEYTLVYMGYNVEREVVGCLVLVGVFISYVLSLPWFNPDKAKENES